MQLADGPLDPSLAYVDLAGFEFDRGGGVVMVSMGVGIENRFGRESFRKHILGGRGKIDNNALVQQDAGMAPVFRVIRAAFPGGTGAEKLNGEGSVGGGSLLGGRRGGEGGNPTDARRKGGAAADSQEISSIHIEKGFLLQN
jgi:hypothetical protein